MSLNSVNIMGNLTRDPELKYTNSGKSVCNLSIANNRSYTSGGEKVTEVSYFDIEVWGAVAENCAKYLSKGRGIIVEGRLKQDRWEKDGKTQSRVRIAANSIHFLPNRRDDNSGQQPASNAGSSSEGQTSEAVAWDE
ncbi:MAG: single-stranded DNA-binding protein [Candidatus Omnitrophica bacterium]|nr:single-stranded DNA-binding protein [Candidatus Omnitrophota bacterium]MCK5260410.1 single-stranded DNA-binding protein [Candidatus Omnitrophota bacterium]